MEKTNSEAGKPDEEKTSKAEKRYSHKSNKKPESAGGLKEGGEGSPPMLGSSENKGDGQAHSPLKQIHAAHEADWSAMDAKHSAERSAMHQRHEANLAKHGHKAETHRAHHEERMRMHHSHSHERDLTHAKHTMDHMTAAGIHGAAGMGGSPEGVTAGQGVAGGPGPSGVPVAAAMGGGAPGAANPGGMA